MAAARMYAAFVVSVFSTSFMARSFFDAANSFVSRTKQADARAIRGMFSMKISLQQGYLRLVGIDIPAWAINFLNDNAHNLHGYIVSLAEAVKLAAIIGSTIAITFWVLSWVILCLDFRAQVLQARRGVWQFNVQKVAIGLSLTYIGTQTSNGLLTYLLVTFIVSVFTIFFVWTLTQDLLWWIIKQNYYFLPIIIPIVIDLIITKIFMKYVVTPKWIKARFLWAAFDLYKILLQIVAGIVKSLVRFVLVVVTVLFSLPRLDRSPFPAWVEMYLLLDSGSKSYQGVILLYHTMNNPVMRVAAWMIQEDAAARKDPATAAQLGLVSAKKRRISNRWNKAWMMYKNPAIAAYSSYGEKGVAMKEMKKALKEIEKEQAKAEKEAKKAFKAAAEAAKPQARPRAVSTCTVPRTRRRRALPRPQLRARA